MQFLCREVELALRGIREHAKKKTSSDDCGANTSLETFQRLLLRQAGASKKVSRFKVAAHNREGSECL